MIPETKQSMFTLKPCILVASYMDKKYLTWSNSDHVKKKQFEEFDKNDKRFFMKIYLVYSISIIVCIFVY